MPKDPEPTPPRGPADLAGVPPRADEPEPEWAEEIRARRRARGDRLREIFSTFDDAADPRHPSRSSERSREEPGT